MKVLSSLSNLNALYFLFCLIAVAKTFKTMLKISGENGYPCFISDLREKDFSFSLLSMMLTVGIYFL